MWAASEGNAAAAEILIAHGADVKAKSTAGFSDHKSWSGRVGFEAPTPRSRTESQFTKFGHNYDNFTLSITPA